MIAHLTADHVALLAHEVGDGALTRMAMQRIFDRIDLVGPVEEADDDVLRCALHPELRQGIALTPVVIGGKRPVLISISHRDDASPSGGANPLLATNWPLPDALTNPRS